MAGAWCLLCGRKTFYSFTHFFSDFKTCRNGCTNLQNVSTMLPTFSSRKRISRWRSSMGRTTRVFSMDAQEKSQFLILKSSKQKKVPVFIMMPLDSFGIDTLGTPRIQRLKALTVSLKALKLAGVHGIAVEVWWGIVEHTSPLVYDWSLYEELFKLISETGLKLHIAFCFHSNIRLSAQQKGFVGLPLWIQKIGASNKDIYYQDQYGVSSDDYLTLGVDEIPLLCGRTALQCYEDFICSFLHNFDSLVGHVVEEVSVGLGPAGELRYPAHRYTDGRWRFPGIGEFQCYDKYMMDDLRMAASQEGNSQWGDNGPQNAGCYNSFPSGTPFFEGGEKSFLSDYGDFFLEWYSGKLIHHADAILGKAADMLKKYQHDDQTSVLLVAKIGEVYWWYKTLSHAAELTAGYYNTAQRDGYDPLALMLFHHGAALQASYVFKPILDCPSFTKPMYLGFINDTDSLLRIEMLEIIATSTGLPDIQLSQLCSFGSLWIRFYEGKRGDKRRGEEKSEWRKVIFLPNLAYDGRIIICLGVGKWRRVISMCLQILSP